MPDGEKAISPRFAIKNTREAPINVIIRVLLRPFLCHSRIRQPVQPCRGR